MANVYMADPAKVLSTYFQYVKVEVDRESFERGKIAVALELITAIKTLNDIPVVSEYGRQEAVGALEAILAKQVSNLDELYDFYESLCAWNWLKFVSQPDLLPEGIAVADGQLSLDLPESDGVLSSRGAYPRDE